LFDTRDEALAEDAVFAQLGALPAHAATRALFSLESAGLYEDQLGSRAAPGGSDEKKARENAQSNSSSHAAFGTA